MPTPRAIGRSVISPAHQHSVRTFSRHRQSAQSKAVPPVNTARFVRTVATHRRREPVRKEKRAIPLPS